LSAVNAADSPQEEGKPMRKLNFRRLLLNKCQEEFEKGDAAMLAVAEREAKKGQGGEEEEQVRCCCCGVLCCVRGCTEPAVLAGIEVGAKCWLLPSVGRRRAKRAWRRSRCAAAAAAVV
jgi:hypothetical protein